MPSLFEIITSKASFKRKIKKKKKKLKRNEKHHKNIDIWAIFLLVTAVYFWCHGEFLLHSLHFRKSSHRIDLSSINIDVSFSLSVNLINVVKRLIICLNSMQSIAAVAYFFFQIFLWCSSHSHLIVDMKLLSVQCAN